MFSIAEIFPVVSFNFEGTASMVVTPEEYLQFDSIVSCSIILLAIISVNFIHPSRFLRDLDIELWHLYNAKQFFCRNQLYGA